ncbi:tetratricopeptide repeat protein [Kitasatospora sp. NPDC058190]|uniref:tetratricopeptide repeat protein n=1 Tax=Kitasatospora sp. NPDC058190 TaxID=3346371 RepID=UPI0036DE8292
MVIGTIPAEASAFQPRTELRKTIDEARARYATIVLASERPGTEPPDPPPDGNPAGRHAPRTQVLAGGGGVGKTQLAAHYARQALGQGTDLVVWTDATETATATAVFAEAAEAAEAVQVPGATHRVEDTEQDAARFLAWLAATDHTWLIVLDNVTDLTPKGPWPTTSRGGHGLVIATTRQRGAAATGAGRTLIDVTAYTPAESADYLRERLTQAGQTRLLDDSAPDLAEDLGHLPLALGHAAAYMINTRRTSSRYLQLFRDRTRTLDTLMPARTGTDGYERPVAAALLITLDAAQHDEPAGLALPALRLAALLDPAGHPQKLWTTPPVLQYLTQHRTTPAQLGPEPASEGEPAAAPVHADDALDALALLHNYNLINLTHEGHRSVALHALTARAALDTTSEPERPHEAAADALLALWPDEDHLDRDLVAVLRANTETLTEHAQERLWYPDGHHLLFRAGLSLLRAGLHAEAVRYWTHTTDTSESILGPDHPATLTDRNNLALSYAEAGRLDDAIPLQKQVLTAREHIHGTDHPATLTDRNNLALSYAEAGRLDDAIPLQKQVLTAREHIHGTDHPATLTDRNNLALSYAEAGRLDDAIPLQEAAVEGRAQVLGARHLETVRSRLGLAVLLTERGRALLPANAAEAWRDASAAVHAVGPHLADDPGRYGPVLADAYRLAADALEADGQPQAAAEYRQRALLAANAASAAEPPGQESSGQPAPT